jgi:hypothetical protein
LIGFDSSIFFDQGISRDIDVLISGSLGKARHPVEVYPVRKWLADVLPEIGVKEGIRVGVFDHPGYFSENKTNHQQAYSDILNRAKIAVGGSSCWRLPLKKFYEAPASGAILLSDLPLEDTDFFRERILEVDPDLVGSNAYEDVVRRSVMETLTDYGSKERLQPFKSEQDKFDRSYEGRALEMRKILQEI